MSRPTRRLNQHNAPRPAKRVVAGKIRATAWAKLNRSPLNKTRIAPRSPISVSITERASLYSINTTATSPGVIHFHERVFDARLHFYERLFRDFRTFMSEFQAPGFDHHTCKCSQHLTGAENGIPITGRREGTRLADAGRKHKIRRPEGSERCFKHERQALDYQWRRDHNQRRDGQNARHSQIPFQRNPFEALLGASKNVSLPQNPRWTRFQKQELRIGRTWRRWP